MSTAPSPRPGLPRLTDRLPLGPELRVSPFALGMTGSADTVLAAYDAGLNFFFLSADMHWPGYEATRRGLAELLSRRPGVRDELVVAVVSYVTQPEFCYAPFQEVLRAVPGLERVDVAVAGGAYGGELATRLPHYEGHRTRRFCGIRAIGASFHERRAALPAFEASSLDMAFVRYNAAHPGAREELFPHLPPHPRPLLYTFKSVSGWVSSEHLARLDLPPGTWQPSPADHYRFVLSRPEVDGVLCSPQTPAQIESLARALEQGPLNEEEQEHLLLLAGLASGELELA